MTNLPPPILPCGRLTRVRFNMGHFYLRARTEK